MGRAAPVGAAVAAGGVAFLNAPGIGQHIFEQVRRGPRTPDRPLPPHRHQPGKQPAMVDMRMGEHDCGNIGRIKTQLPVVKRFERPAALKQPAIDKDVLAPLSTRQFHTGAGHGLGRAVKGDRKRGLRCHMSSSVMFCQKVRRKGRARQVRDVAADLRRCLCAGSKVGPRRS